MTVYAIKKCDNCGKDVEICHKERLNRKNFFCSKKCEGEYRRKQRGDDWYNCTCPICGKQFHLKPSELKKAKHQPVCSYKCLAEYRKTIYLGENNPNYDHHTLQKYKVGDTKVSHYGYILEYVGREFYKFGKTNEAGFEFQHKLIAEKYLADETNADYITEVGWVLRKEFVVHHKDGNKQNNNVSNLQIMTRSEHTKLHNPKQDKPKPKPKTRKKKAINPNSKNFVNWKTV